MGWCLVDFIVASHCLPSFINFYGMIMWSKARFILNAMPQVRILNMFLLNIIIHMKYFDSLRLCLFHFPLRIQHNWPPGHISLLISPCKYWVSCVRVFWLSRAMVEPLVQTLVRTLSKSSDASQIGGIKVDTRRGKNTMQESAFLSLFSKYSLSQYFISKLKRKKTAN